MLTPSAHFLVCGAYVHVIGFAAICYSFVVVSMLDKIIGHGPYLLINGNMYHVDFIILSQIGEREFCKTSPATCSASSC
jgi:hypothetical protein